MIGKNIIFTIFFSTVFILNLYSLTITIIIWWCTAMMNDVKKISFRKKYYKISMEFIHIKIIMKYISKKNGYISILFIIITSICESNSQHVFRWIFFFVFCFWKNHFFNLIFFDVFFFSLFNWLFTHNDCISFFFEWKKIWKIQF